MILIIIIFIIIAFIEIPSLVKKKLWKDLAVFSGFFLFAFIIAIVQTAEIELPSLIQSITYVMKDLLHISYK